MSKFQITTKIANDLTVALGSTDETDRSHEATPFLPMAVFGSNLISFYRSKVNPAKNSGINSLRQTTRHGRTTLAYLTDMLRGVVQTGTARAASSIPCELAAKTGTNLITMLTHYLWVTVLSSLFWRVGFDQRKPLGHGETGAVTAGRIWRDVMADHCAKDNPRDMTFSNELSWVDVDHETDFYQIRCR
ncbi:MAG: hypothetical protein R2877_01905 [Bdellovibrionota bacterium]